MGRPAGANGAETMRAIRAAALKRIYEHGYEAMNLRDLAADVGLRVGSLYNYIPQKQEFLGTLLESIMRELLEDFKQQMGKVSGAREAMQQFVRFHIKWHTARKEEVFIGNMELRSLSEEQYARVTAMRKEYELHLRGILSQGKKDGLWFIENTAVTAKALLSLLTGVSNWYREDGGLTQERLIRLYQLMVERMLQKVESDASEAT
ncbi:TetR/AcrR family transcriptional regulator [Polaromonas sp. P1(28)-13]|nr:TetR/AcrR family transcriptional regulator [Polaromonas sp. P1(28)-13]